MHCHKSSNVKLNTFDIVPSYSLPVRIGNWNTDLAIEESKLEFNEYKRNHCQLLVSKTRTMLRNVLRPVSISMAIEDIQYGSFYQILASEIPTSSDRRNSSKGLILSGLINETDLEYNADFRSGCMITASPGQTACRRNAFKLISSNNKEGPLSYGDNFFIQINTNPGESPLYLQAENSTLDTFGEHLNVKLSGRPDFYCHFKMLHWQPRIRNDFMGSKVLPGSTVIIQHISSGRNLAVETLKWIPTFFGNECVVTCHSFKNSNMGEMPQNMWKIIGRREPDIGRIIRAAKGQDISLDTIDIELN